MESAESVRLEDGIFGLIINLCKNYEAFGSPEEARKRVAEWLEQIARGLRSLNSPQQTGETEHNE